MPVTDAYDNLNKGKQLYFLNSENNPVQVKSIEKQKYQGKIYNVPVANDTILSFFNYTDGSDSAEIDVLVTVPPAEPPGAKSSRLVFTGWYVREI